VEEGTRGLSKRKSGQRSLGVQNGAGEKITGKKKRGVAAKKRTKIYLWGEKSRRGGEKTVAKYKLFLLTGKTEAVLRYTPHVCSEGFVWGRKGSDLHNALDLGGRKGLSKKNHRG